MPTFASLKQQADSPSLLRKGLQVIAFAAKASDADLPANITGPDMQPLALPEAFFPLGMQNTDGWEFEADTDKDETESLGYAQPPRVDINKVAKTAKISLQESFRRDITELMYGLDLSQVTQDAESGEIVYDYPALPETFDYRLLVIARDGTPGNEWLWARGYYTARLSELPSETLNAELLEHEITFDILLDEDSGSSQRDYIAGSAAKANAAKLGFTAG